MEVSSADQSQICNQKILLQATIVTQNFLLQLQAQKCTIIHKIHLYYNQQLQYLFKTIVSTIRDQSLTKQIYSTIMHLIQAKSYHINHIHQRYDAFFTRLLKNAHIIHSHLSYLRSNSFLTSTNNINPNKHASAIPQAVTFNNDEINASYSYIKVYNLNSKPNSNQLQNLSNSKQRSNTAKMSKLKSEDSYNYNYNYNCNYNYNSNINNDGIGEMFPLKDIKNVYIGIKTENKNTNKNKNKNQSNYNCTIPKIKMEFTGSLSNAQRSMYGDLYKQISDKKYQCKLCKRKKYYCKYSTTAVKHIKTKHKKQASKAKKKFLESKIPKSDENYIITKNFHWKCRLCNSILTTKGGAKTHLFYVHGNIKLFTCQYCDKKFKTRNTCAKHEQIHTGIKPYTCRFCNKKFRHYTSFKRHERIHTGERPYVCDYCGKGFSGSSSLKVHVRTHTGEIPYKCSIKGCGKSYKSAHGLRDHMKKHAGIERKVECDLCGKILVGKGSLRAHRLKVHKAMDHLPCECDICGTRASTPWGVKMHKAQVHKVDMYVPI